MHSVCAQMPDSGMAVHLPQTFSDPVHFSTAKQRSLAAGMLSAERTDTKPRGDPGCKSLLITMGSGLQVNTYLNGPGMLDPDAIMNWWTPNPPTWAQLICFIDQSVMLGPAYPAVNDPENLAFTTGKGGGVANPKERIRSSSATPTVD